MIKVERMPEGRKIETLSKTECPFCDAELSFCYGEDVVRGQGGYGIDCPVCGSFVCVKEINECKYPIDFFDFSDCVDISNEEVQEAIDKVRAILFNSEDDSNYLYWACGNTLVIGVKSAEEVSIFVTKNYAEWNQYFE